MGKEKGHHSAPLADDVGNRKGIEPKELNNSIGINIRASKGQLTYSGVLQPGFEPKLEFTGTVFGLVRRPHNGFANYSIVELVIENGKVVGAHYSQPHAGIPAMGQMDILNNEQLADLRKKYPSEYAMAVL